MRVRKKGQLRKVEKRVGLCIMSGFRAKDLNLLGPMCVSSLYSALLWVRGPAWRTKLVHLVGARQRACGLHSHSSGLLNRGVVSYEVLGTDDIAPTS